MPNYDYNATYEDLQDQDVEMMHVGHQFYTYNQMANEIKLKTLEKIKYRHGYDDTHYVYNLDVEDYNTFFTNGILGHNIKVIFDKDIVSLGGCFDAGTKILMADGTEKNIENI